MKSKNILIYLALMSVLLAVSTAKKETKPNPIKTGESSSEEEQEGEKDYIDEDHLGSSESEESGGTTAAATTTKPTRKSKTKKPPTGTPGAETTETPTAGPPSTPGAGTTGAPAVGTTSAPRSRTTAASSEEDTTDQDGKKRRKSWRDRRKERRRKRMRRRVSITGSYSLKTDPDNDDFKDYLKEMGFKESAQKSITKNKRVMITIKKLNKTHWNVKRSTPNKTMELTFKSGKQFVARLADSRKKNATVTIDEKGKNATRILKMDDFNATDSIIFSMRGFNITMKAREASATLEFRRLTRGGQIIRNIFKAFKRPFKHWGRRRRNRTSGDKDDDDMDDDDGDGKKKKFPFFKKWRGKD